MNSEQKVVYPLDDLRYEIDELIKKKEFNSILRDISAEFERKGMDTKSLKLLLNEEDKTASSLNDYELIAISSIAYKKLEDVAFNPSMYFGENMLLKYEDYERKEVILDKIVLKDFRKINDDEYRGQIAYKDLCDYFDNHLITYNYSTQRSPKYRNIGSVNGKSKLLKVQNVNEDTVSSIAQSILGSDFEETGKLNGNFEDTEIVLNCEYIEGKDQRFKFIPKYDLDFIGDIVIELDYDEDSPFMTKVTIPDGYHRVRGIMLASTIYFQKTGMFLEGEIGVRLVRATKERAKRIVYQTFLRSPDKLEWVEALKEDDYTKFVDNIVEQSKFLTIENTLEDVSANNKLTSKLLLVDVIKYTDIIVNSSSKRKFLTKTIADNFDIIYEELKNKININPYTVAMFVYLAYLCDKDTNKLIKAIEEFSKGENINIINKKRTNIEKYLNTVDNLMEGAIDNE